MYGICHLGVVPCRFEPSDKSEMVTQLLFGETFEILKQEGKWLQIRITLDGYECWIDEKQYLPLSEEQYKKQSAFPVTCSADLVDLVTKSSDNSLTPVLAGSALPAYEHGKLFVGDQEFSFDGEITHPLSENENIPALVAEYATVFLNAPYLWGGRSVFGIDCSGFTQVVFKMAGIQLKRDAYQQAEQGITLSFVEEAQTGDLAFFDNEEGKIIHTGIVLPQGKIIHASGKVRVDKLDHQGIFNNDTKKYSHKLRLIKRVLQK